MDLEKPKPKPITVYDIMENSLKDNARSIKTIKNLGHVLISKMKMLDEEIKKINPNRGKWIELDAISNKKLGLLYSLRNQYRSQFDIISVVLNKSDRIVDTYTINSFLEYGLDENLIIKPLEDK